MKTILLVDDNEGFKYLLKTLFETNNCRDYKFIEAANPVEALNKYYQYNKKIDIVICDFFLPVQNGNELLEIIKGQSPMTKCLLISADDHLKTKKFNNVDEIFSKMNMSSLIEYIKKMEEMHF